MEKEYLAHIAEDGREQTVKEHCRNTAEYASYCCKSIGLENTAYLTGLMHDLGKESVAFQEYIKGKAAKRRGEVIHTFQGCKYLCERYGSTEDVYRRYAAELLAYAVGAHHGSFDCVDEMRRIGLQYRVEKQNMGYAESSGNFLRDCAQTEEIDRLFSMAVDEIKQVVEGINRATPSDEEFCFLTGLLARLLLSAVIEGDRRDTASFMSNVDFEKWPEDMRTLWTERLRYAEAKIAEFPTATPIDRARKEISDRCRRYAENPGSIYRLNVPTGSGKTLSSLRYALAHAAEFNKKHIIFTSPLLSILEQNAAEIHKYVGDDSIILEHHSNVICEEKSTEELDKRELLVQTWDAPIIITTMVQLLNTLFSGKTSAIRRFHSLCESVIVIDEVQTVPVHMLTLFNLAMRFISDYCGATVLLCSATQPCLEKAAHPLKDTISDVIPYDAELWKPFRRTEIKSLEPMRLEELPALIADLMKNTQSLLVICNKKDDAAKLVEKTRSCNWTSFHLSAGMCMQHRRDTVNALKQALDTKQKTLCISTQVIEAGVDISFQSVVRLAAGMDSVVQSAGRCNRNGESEIRQPVYLVNCTDENLGKLRVIQHGKTATINLVEAYNQSPERFGNDLSSEAAISYYYEHLYADIGSEAQDYFVPRLKATLFDLLSVNEKYAANCNGIENYALRQAFRTAGENFTVFDEKTVDVIVPYGEGKRIIEDICSQRALSDMIERQKLLREATSYTVSLYNFQYEKLKAQGALFPVCDGYAIALREEYYDTTIGMKSADLQTYQEV